MTSNNAGALQQQQAAITSAQDKGIALVVDDEAVNRMILQAQLQKSGYRVVMAENGREAIEQFESQNPDIIFMDVMMPEVDGYEATREIKKRSGENFIPVIFLTAITSEEDLARCIDAGGDDFLSKPFSQTLLKARIDAIERVRDLHRTVQKQHAVLLHDEEIAEQVFSKVIMADNAEMHKLQTLLRPAVTFSGDIMMSARSPSGELYILLGDFTGHGLVASIGALPASEIFRTMTSKGFTLSSILTEMNSKLYRLLPADKFLAVCAVSLSADMKTAHIWNGGLPEVMIIRNGEVRASYPANHLALGIIDEIDNAQMDMIEVTDQDKIFVMTDGVIEANNDQDEMYGMQRLLDCIKKHDNENLVLHIEEDLNLFIGDHEQLDDISLVNIPCLPELGRNVSDNIASHKQTGLSLEDSQINETMWKLVYSMGSSALSEVNPVPIVLSQLEDMLDIKSHKQSLFLILTELYVNALDHGVLNLDSSLKASPDGFAEYMDNRAHRLENITQGQVEIRIARIKTTDEHCILKIGVIDSGEGFDFTRRLQDFTENENFSGRGIKLLDELCESVHYHGNGNHAEVVYLIH